MDKATFDLKDIQRLQKRGIRQAEAQGAAVAPEGERDTLPGWFTKKKQRYNKVRDVLNIGSGTRCVGCVIDLWISNLVIEMTRLDYERKNNHKI